MAVGNREALAALAQVKSNVDSGIFRPVQEAAIQALGLGPAWIAQRNDIYRKRIALLVEGLAAAGMPVSPPRATLYLWVPIPAGWSSSEAFALQLLQQTGVALAPGTFFGPAGERHLRISVTAPAEQLQEAMLRLGQFVRREERYRSAG